MTRVTFTPLLLAVLLAACGQDPRSAPTTTSVPPVIDPGDRGEYEAELDPAQFATTIDNPYLPLTPGSRWAYRETNEEGEIEQIEVVVTDETRLIEGITATVVRDTVTLDGQLVEETFDWFAQDVEGNVWYLGEAVSNYDDAGRLQDHDGSFEAGVDGAQAGIVMLADPRPGDAYRQEYYPGNAEDLGEVVRTGEQVTVPTGTYRDVLVTRDWNPLEPAVVEEKWYAPGVGLVYEATVEGDPSEAVLVEAVLAGVRT